MRVLPKSADDNPLKKFFEENQGLLLHKWHHYFDIYHNHFSRFRGMPVRLLEIGIYRGGSLRMWRDYFGPQAEIIGVDKDPRCKQFEGENMKVIIGDQGDREFLRQLSRDVGTVDILIDDGGHRMHQQILTFDMLYRMVKPDGIYLVEDIHTSYWPEFGGGVARSGTFMEKAKMLIDSLNAWHSVSPDYGPNEFTVSATGLHFYSAALVIEKCQNREAPTASATGHDPFREHPSMEELETKYGGKPV